MGEREESKQSVRKRDGRGGAGGGIKRLAVFNDGRRGGGGGAGIKRCAHDYMGVSGPVLDEGRAWEGCE